MADTPTRPTETQMQVSAMLDQLLENERELTYVMRRQDENMEREFPQEGVAHSLWNRRGRLEVAQDMLRRRIVAAVKR